MKLEEIPRRLRELGSDPGQPGTRAEIQRLMDLFTHSLPFTVASGAVGVVLSRTVLHDPAARVRSYAYHAYPRPGRLGQAIRTDRYRLVRWTEEKTGARDYELYDLVADPEETRNQAATLPAVRQRLEAILDAQPQPKPINSRPRHPK